MAAIVTDQFRVQNATTFIDSIDNNSYYVFLGLANPYDVAGSTVGFGRTTTWDPDTAGGSIPPPPIDNQSYLSHYRDTILFGKRITQSNVRRVVKKIQWTANTKYDMYRHDYDIYNKTPNSSTARLYDSNFYVVNKDYRVYICLYNGSSGNNVTGEPSQDEPTFTDLEPSAAGDSNDGYIWKYLFTIAPSDIVKFDSTEYIILPNDWDTSTDFEIKSIRDSGNSTVNRNQIKIVYIENSGSEFYETGTYPILGDGTGAEVQITANTSGEIVRTRVVNGGSGYTFGIVDLKSDNSIEDNPDKKAKLVPIIPPSKGHGYDLYTELGADKVLVYTRFDTSTKEFSANTRFAQVGIIKNPEQYSSALRLEGNTFTGLNSIKLSTIPSTLPRIGELIQQSRLDESTAQGIVAAYDQETNVLKYYQDRSLYLTDFIDTTDGSSISQTGQVLSFESSGNSINSTSGFEGSVDQGFNGSTLNLDNNTGIVGLGVTFTDGLAQPEINKSTGDIIYIDNRSIVSRSIRQKEDVKIILEF